MPEQPAGIGELVRLYCEAAEGTGTIDPKVQPKRADQLQRYYRLLRESEEGRAAIIGLMSSPNRHVRVAAAAHSLAWVPETARSVLEELRDSHGPRSFEAEWILREFDKGRLSFEW